MEGIHSYLMTLVGVSLMTAAALSVIPKGSVRRAAGLTCGLILALAVLRPIAELDDASLAQAFSRLQMEAETARTGVEIKNKELVSTIIKEKTEAYILDKAEEWKLTVRVEVTMETEGTYPYPYSVTIIGKPLPAQQSQLQEYIANEIGIPSERQVWKSSE